MNFYPARRTDISLLILTGVIIFDSEFLNVYISNIKNTFNECLSKTQYVLLIPLNLKNKFHIFLELVHSVFYIYLLFGCVSKLFAHNLLYIKINVFP